MNEEIKKGDKIWIQFGYGYVEAKIVSLPNNGALVEYLQTYRSSGKLGFIDLILGLGFLKIETKEQFNNRIVK